MTCCDSPLNGVLSQLSALTSNSYMLLRSTVNNDTDNENINLKKGGVRERCDLPLSINYQQVRAGPRIPSRPSRPKR